MTVIVNPGSGPVADASEINAWFNMGVFTGDLIADSDGPFPDVLRQADGDDGGRFRFQLRFPTRNVEVDMPGIPLSRVRYMNEDGQNIWDFPRLYVNGSSWVWCYALGAASREDEDDS